MLAVFAVSVPFLPSPEVLNILVSSFYFLSALNSLVSLVLCVFRLVSLVSYLQLPGHFDILFIPLRVVVRETVQTIPKK